MRNEEADRTKKGTAAVFAPRADCLVLAVTAVLTTATAAPCPTNYAPWRTFETDAERSNLPGDRPHLRPRATVTPAPARNRDQHKGSGEGEEAQGPPLSAAAPVGGAGKTEEGEGEETAMVGGKGEGGSGAMKAGVRLETAAVAATGGQGAAGTAGTQASLVVCGKFR